MNNFYSSIYKAFIYAGMIAFIIGFFTDNKMDGLKMILCHEIAHASQFYLYKVNYFRDTPHGETFKTIYRKIRKQFLNSTLPDQEPLREEFCKQATDFTKLAMSEL